MHISQVNIIDKCFIMIMILILIMVVVFIVLIIIVYSEMSFPPMLS